MPQKHPRRFGSRPRRCGQLPSCQCESRHWEVTMTTVRLATFNCENLFARYKFEAGPPGTKKVLTPQELDQHWGFLPPERWKKSFQILSEDGWRDLTAKALKGKDGYPDIACLEEVESLPALRRFNQDFLAGHYTHAVLIDGHDPRSIDVGVLSTL